ncbi:MAG TPA: cupin domain-containing protein [Holophaga sp.]|nr:cupin domain-containing protein [Holophaga sp.]
MSPALTCRDVAASLTDYRERAIPLASRIRTGMHLRRCPACRRLLSELETLPSVFRHLPDASLPGIGEAALAHALQHLAEPRRRHLPGSAVPDAVRQLLENGPDRPLLLLARAHAAFMRGAAPESEPFLPDEILAELPVPGAWTWRRSSDGVRRACLSGRPGEPCLFLVHMPPGFASRRHVHCGTESILVLEGVLEDGDRCLVNGDWVHKENGSSHAPCALLDGCWCLVREEGTFLRTDLWGRLRHWLG